MIKVVTYPNKLIISGHANFDNYGKDIVCASVSSIVTASVNDMMTVKKEAINYSDDGNELIIEIIKDDELIYKLFNNLVALLKSLAQDYPKNIVVKED